MSEEKARGRIVKPSPTMAESRVVPRRSGPPRGASGPALPPPTLQAVAALAAKERVPMRIAKGELEGKMKCRIWRKLHSDEAKRFDQAYALVAQHAELSLADAFGVVQSGLSTDDFLARRARTERRSQVKAARHEIDNRAIAALFESWSTAFAELSVVLAERTLMDVLDTEQPVALKLKRSGRVEKLKVVLVAPRSLWEGLVPSLERDSKLVQRPAPVPREPERRPYADPRPFAAKLGETVRLVVRNGMKLEEKLCAAGPFDLVLRSTDPAQALLVPMHAIVRWEDDGEGGQVLKA